MKSTGTHPRVLLRTKFLFLVCSLLAGAAVYALAIPGDALAQPASVALGDAAPFAVLGNSTVTNAGDATTSTSVVGDLGVSPGTAVTNITAGMVTGTIYTFLDPPAVNGQISLTAAIIDAEGQSPVTQTLAELGGLTLGPGIYFSGSTMAITGSDLTLDGGGDGNAVWVFQIGSTLTVGSGLTVILNNGAHAANVFWQVGSSATIGTDAVFNGTIMADASVTLNNGVWLCGRALARDAAVSLEDNTVILPGNCQSLPVELSSFSATTDGLDVILRWETLSESNNSGFEVQHQPDNGWEIVAFVPGAGNSTDRLSYQYRATELGSGTHRFRLKQIDFDGSFEYSPVVEVDITVERYNLSAAYPNPFRLTTTLPYALPQDSEVRLSVFDVLGREIKVLVAGPRPAGSHDVVFDASGLPEGAYFYRLQARDFEDIKGLVVLK